MDKGSSPHRGEIRETLLVVAGEHSGDLLGGDVVRSLRREGFSRFVGTGGDSMEQAGVELVESVENMTVVGFVEALKAYRRLKGLAERLVVLCEERKIRFALLIDYPGFNLRLAEMLQARGIHVVYLVSPQIWAWKYGRIKGIRRNVDLMLTLFPFEKELYDAEGVRAEWIGHPLISRMEPRLKQEEPIKGRATITVGLLPGSRTSEVTRLLPMMLESAERLQKEYSGIRFLLPGVNPDMDAFIKEQLAAHPDLHVEYLWNRSLRVMEASDLVILASGTATLETAWFLKPMIILYRVGTANFLIASMVIRTKFIGMVNLLARRQVALELLQTEADPGNVVDEARRILEDKNYRADIIQELQYVKSSLGRGDPARVAAGHIRDFVLTERKRKRE